MTGLESAGAFGAGKYRYECMTKCDQKQKTIAFESNTATITKIHDPLFFISHVNLSHRFSHTLHLSSSLVIAEPHSFAFLKQLS